MATILAMPIGHDDWLLANMELYDQISFSDSEMQDLYESEDVESWLLVHLNAHVNDTRGEEALAKAVEQAPTNRLVAFQLAQYCSDFAEETSFLHCSKDAFVALISIDPPNMVSDFVLAGFLFKNREYLAASKALESGNQKSRLDFYTEDYFNLGVKAATDFKHPLYVAHYTALGAALPAMVFAPWMDMCSSADSNVPINLYSECLGMGEKIEANSLTILEKSFGLAIQIHAHEALGSDESVLKTLKARQGTMSSVADRTRVYPVTLETEKMSAQFYADVFEVGEVNAFELLEDKLEAAASDSKREH